MPVLADLAQSVHDHKSQPGGWRKEESLTSPADPWLLCFYKGSPLFGGELKSAGGELWSKFINNHIKFFVVFIFLRQSFSV